MNAILAGLVAALVAFLDVQKTFYLPKNRGRRLALHGWIASFVLVNGVLAGVTYSIIREFHPFSSWNQTLLAVTAGISYLVIIRTRLTTFEWQGQEVPFGFDLLYEQGKRFVYVRINRIARDARSREALDLATATELGGLIVRARLNVLNDRLLTPEEKTRDIDWLRAIIEDVELDDAEKRIYVASYILSGDLLPRVR